MAKGSLGYKVRTIVCAGCGKPHTGHLRPAQRFCSLNCYRSAPSRPSRRTGVVLICSECGSNFYVPRYRAATARLCSTKCNADEQRRVRPTNVGIVANMRRVQQRQQRSTAPTKPELALYAILDALPVVYERQFTIDELMTVDACVLSLRLVIQADGDYWHGRHGTTEHRVANRLRLDHSQDAYLLNHGWTVIRLWGSDLLKRPNECRDTLLRHLRPLREAVA